MTLHCLEISLRIATPAAWERAATIAERFAEEWLGDGDQESVVLATCARLEVYAVGEDAAMARAQVQIGRLTGMSLHRVASNSRVAAGRRVTRHLLRVAAGLESPIPGEDAILGQVRRALKRAVECGKVGATLSTLFRGAIHAGRRVRRESGLGRGLRPYAELALAAAPACRNTRTW